MKKGWIIAGVAGLLAVGTFFVVQQFRKLSDLCFVLSDIQFEKINRERITFTVNLRVKNESQFTVNIEGYNLKVYLNNAFVATLKGKRQATLKPNEFSVLSLVVDIAVKDVKALANWYFTSSILLDINNTVLAIHGDLSANINGVGVRNLPVDVKLKVKEAMGSGESKPCL